MIYPIARMLGLAFTLTVRRLWQAREESEDAERYFHQAPFVEAQCPVCGRLAWKTPDDQLCCSDSWCWWQNGGEEDFVARGLIDPREDDDIDSTPGETLADILRRRHLNERVLGRPASAWGVPAEVLRQAETLLRETRRGKADDHYKRGVKAYEAERLDEAIAEFSKALDHSGGEGRSMKWDAHAYAYRAGAYAVLEDIGSAVSDLEKARSLIAAWTTSAMTRDPDLKAHVESQLQELREEIDHATS